jgi:hypothetical protein
MGTPPVTEKDYYIAQFFLYSFGMKTDPIHGSPVSPHRPANYEFESHGPGIIVSMSVSIVVMTIITLLRLGIRIFRQGLRLGLDHIFIVPGLVCVLRCPFLHLSIMLATREAGLDLLLVWLLPDYDLFLTCSRFSR